MELEAGESGTVSDFVIGLSLVFSHAGEAEIGARRPEGSRAPSLKF